MQLDDACRRSDDGAGIAGPLTLLSIWSWERLPVGRPKPQNFNPWPEHHGNNLLLPTWAYKWDVVPQPHGDVDNLYAQYTNELDALTPEQVIYSLTTLTPISCNEFF